MIDKPIVLSPCETQVSCDCLDLRQRVKFAAINMNAHWGYVFDAIVNGRSWEDTYGCAQAYSFAVYHVLGKSCCPLALFSDVYRLAEAARVV